MVGAFHGLDVFYCFPEEAILNRLDDSAGPRKACPSGSALGWDTCWFPCYTFHRQLPNVCPKLGENNTDRARECETNEVEYRDKNKDQLIID